MTNNDKIIKIGLCRSYYYETRESNANSFSLTNINVPIFLTIIIIIYSSFEMQKKKYLSKKVTL